MRGYKEYHDCRRFYEWACWQPMLKEYLIKHVNEGKRSVVMGRLLKLIGMRTGLLDYQLLLPNKNWNGLWLEMKTTDERGKKKRDSQDEWIARLLKIKHYATYAYGSDEAIQIVKDYLTDKI